MRLFVALNLPEPIRVALDRALGPVRELGLDARWTVPESFHLTLQFLGGVHDGRVQEVEGALAGVAARHEPFDIDIGRLGAFPNARRARIWWVGIEPSPPLLALQGEVRDALEPLGFEPEARAYHPHLTVARVNRGARNDSDLGEGAARCFAFRSRTPVHTLDLMRSRLLRGGARYEAVKVFPFRRLEGEDR